MKQSVKIKQNKPLVVKSSYRNPEGMEFTPRSVGMNKRVHQSCVSDTTPTVIKSWMVVIQLQSSAKSHTVHFFIDLKDNYLDHVKRFKEDLESIKIKQIVLHPVFEYLGILA